MNALAPTYARFPVEFASGEGCVLVEDDGKGMGPAREGGLGLTLVNAFTAQLGGRVEHHEVEKGTRIGVCFPTAL